MVIININININIIKSIIIINLQIFSLFSFFGEFDNII